MSIVGETISPGAIAQRRGVAERTWPGRFLLVQGARKKTGDVRDGRGRLNWVDLGWLMVVVVLDSLGSERGAAFLSNKLGPGKGMNVSRNRAGIIPRSARGRLSDVHSFI